MQRTNRRLRKPELSWCFDSHFCGTKIFSRVLGSWLASQAPAILFRCRSELPWLPAVLALSLPGWGITLAWCLLCQWVSPSRLPLCWGTCCPSRAPHPSATVPTSHGQSCSPACLPAYLFPFYPLGTDPISRLPLVFPPLLTPHWDSLFLKTTLSSCHWIFQRSLGYPKQFWHDRSFAQFWSHLFASP